MEGRDWKWRDQDEFMNEDTRMELFIAGFRELRAGLSLTISRALERVVVYNFYTILILMVGILGKRYFVGTKCQPGFGGIVYSLCCAVHSASAAWWAENL